MAEPFIGEICMFGFNFAPRGWSTCAGQILPISQYTALFSLLGTTYGGDGRTNFALPDLRSRVPLCFGQGPGQPDYVLGESGGAPSVTLTNAGQVPPHNHPATAVTALSQTTQASATLKGATDTGTASGPEGNNLATTTANIYKSGPRTLKDMAATSIAVTQPAFSASTTVTVQPNQGGLPVEIMNPYLAVNFCIALEGIFPSRN